MNSVKRKPRQEKDAKTRNIILETFSSIGEDAASAVSDIIDIHRSVPDAYGGQEYNDYYAFKTLASVATPQAFEYIISKGLKSSTSTPKVIDATVQSLKHVPQSKLDTFIEPLGQLLEINPEDGGTWFQIHSRAFEQLGRSGHPV